MSLIQCQECNSEISDKTTACPHCGYPLIKSNAPQEMEPVPPTPPDNERQYIITSSLNKQGKKKVAIIIAIFFALLIICNIGYYVYDYYQNFEYWQEIKAMH